VLACGLVIERIVVNPKCYRILCDEISSALPPTEVLSPQVKMACLFGYPFTVEARHFIGIEIDPDSHRIAEARIKHIMKNGMQMKLSFLRSEEKNETFFN